jgi:hypothetical protein
VNLNGFSRDEWILGGAALLLVLHIHFHFFAFACAVYAAVVLCVALAFVARQADTGGGYRSGIR